MSGKRRGEVRGRRLIALVAGGLSSGFLAVLAACAQVLGVEPGMLSGDGAVDGARSEAGPGEASLGDGDADGSGPVDGTSFVTDSSGPETSSDTGIDAGGDVAMDALPDAPPIPACDAGGSDAATASFGPWYAVGPARFSPGAVVTGVTPVAGEVALFAVDKDGQVVTTQARAPFGAAAWSDWAPVTTDALVFAPGAPISAVARGNARVDLFAVRGDGVIVTVTNGSGAGWVPVATGGPTFAPQRVGAIVRDLSDVHVFAIANGQVYESTAAGSGPFTPWSVIGVGDSGSPSEFPSTSAVSAASKDPTSLDVFVIGSDGNPYTLTRSYSPTDTGWQPWATAGVFAFPPGTVISPIARVPTQYDLYTLDSQEIVRGLLHNYDQPPQSWSDGGWSDWWTVPGVSALVGSRLVARTGSTNLYIFVIDQSGAIMMMEFSAVTLWGKWIPLSPCSAAVPSTSLEVVSGTGTAMEAASVDPWGRVVVADRASVP